MFTASVLGACAANGGLDVDALETDLLARTLPDRPGVIESVSCPRPLAPVAGDIVACEVMIGSQTAPLNVTFGPGKGVVATAVVDARLVDMATVEAVLATEFERDLGIETSLQCPQPVMVVAPGDSVECTAIDASDAARVLRVTPTGQSITVEMIG